MKKTSVLFLIALTIAFLYPVQSLHSQTYKFQKYGANSGICHQFIYSINQDNNGFIWMASGIGICRFDGFSFGYKTRDSLPETQSSISYKDKYGRLWFGYNDGSIAIYNGKKFTILRANTDNSSVINHFAEDSYGNVLAATQNAGLISIDKDLKKSNITDPFKGKLIYTLVLIAENRLLIGTSNGLELYAYDKDPSKIHFLSIVKETPLTKINCIQQSLKQGIFWIGTEDAGLFKLTVHGNDRFDIDNPSKSIKLQDEDIQSILEDPQGYIWIATKAKGLFRASLDLSSHKILDDVLVFNSTNGLDQDAIKCIFRDREGNIWVGTYGSGLEELVNESFTYFNFKNEIRENNILAVCAVKDGFWVGGTNAIVHVKSDGSGKSDVYGPSKGLPEGEVTALFQDSKEDLWIGTASKGVYILSKGSERIHSYQQTENSLGNSINSISGSKENIYISTKNGIYHINTITHKQEHFSTSEGIPPLPYNNVHQVFIDPKNNGWVATRSNALFSLNTDITFNPKGAGELEFSAITEDESGNLWAGTNGNGIFEFLKDTLFYFNKNLGLKSDYCYTLTADLKGNIWAGHQQGISRINTKTHQVKVYGNEYVSGDVNANAASRDSKGNILLGTTDGLIIVETTKNRLTAMAPLPNITSIVINDKEYSPFDKIVLPYGSYRMRIEFIGLNYANADQVTYQYKLEGFDPVWSEPTKNRNVIYSKLTFGDYQFVLKAFNGDGICCQEPVIFYLKIRKPFWSTWWFYVIIAVLLIVSVYYIIKTREEKQRKFQAYLEKLLDERTREVREQKEEIELKNRDITDSINYAQRIQASILPSLRKLQHIFTGSFVYYAPRDIVSGDFYWFEVIPDTSKFLVVCADSTGHGVPGAFMSIIGTTLLKDIYTRSDVQKPSDILNLLDRELKSTLNQNIEGERPSDGMDIIVCEIDIKTYITRFSSAMRPFIVYQNGEQLYFKGSRSSIGGQTKEEKCFEDVELQLTKGDLIYMFSDGYPDQFGGPMGKKFKMVRLRNLLKDIHQKPMEEQFNYVKSNFEIWKDELEQVDDVLFMGIKI